MQAKSVKELGAILRELRISRGQTQSDLAEAIEVTQSAVSEVEKGYAGASIGLIFKMLRALEAPFNVGAGALPEHIAVPDDEDFIDLDAIANTGLKRK